MQYHTLNVAAENVWRACDGTAVISAIVSHTGLPVDIVETTIGELGEAGLLQTSANNWSVPLSRRQADKLIAAGAAGVVGVPVALSITAPDSASAASPQCPAGIARNVTGCSMDASPCYYQGWDYIQCCVYTGHNTTIWWSVGCAGI